MHERSEVERGRLPCGLPLEGGAEPPLIAGQGGTNITTRLEAFMHQVKEYAKVGE